MEKDKMKRIFGRKKDENPEMYTYKSTAHEVQGADEAGRKYKQLPVKSEQDSIPYSHLLQSYDFPFKPRRYPHAKCGSSAFFAAGLFEGRPENQLLK